MDKKYKNLGDTENQKELPPEIVKCHCPDKPPKGFEIGIEKCREIDLDYTVWKLKELILDPVTKDDTTRISNLLYEFEEGLQCRGYMLKHLPALVEILAFLSDKAKTVEDYRQHFLRLLNFCKRPPLLETTSEGLACSDIMERYFTLLSYLLTILAGEEEILKVHEALHSLLIRTVPDDRTVVKAELCRLAMEKTNLPYVLTDLLNNSLPKAYHTILETVYLLSSISCVCSYKMLEAGILNLLLIRLDLSYATEVWCKSPPVKQPLRGENYPDETMFLTMNILWALTRSILLPKGTPVCLKDLRPPVQCALWGLRYGFKRHVEKSNNRKFNARIRNEIAMLILTFLQLFPSWLMVHSGIADDVFTFLIGSVSGTICVWSKEIKFTVNKENLTFIKTLLLIVSHLADFDACIPIMVETNVLQTVLQLVDLELENEKSIWSPPEFWHLFEYALTTLTKLVPKMAENFVKLDGTRKLIIIIDWCLSKEFDSEFTANCVRAIYSIVMSEDPILLNDFREHQMTLQLMKLIDRILNIDAFVMDHQRILTILLIVVERLIKCELNIQLLYGEKNITFITRLLERCLCQKEGDFQVDQRLLLAIGSYIWQCIIQCQIHLKNFLDKGTIYTILDIIEIACYPVRCLFLGLLTDMCEYSFCGQYLCTWRGMDKNTGLMSLLAKIWREEEIHIGVRKSLDGPIEDVELPQMGVSQWLNTYHTKMTYDISPTMIDIIGSTRSKIYSIRRIIDMYGEKYEMAKDHYKILISDLPNEDQLTMSCVDHYLRLKLGEACMEISRYLCQVGVSPIGMDGQVMFLMTQRHRSWGLFIQERQKKVKARAKNAEVIEEKDEYARIRDTLLAPSFDALDELEYVRRTTDRSYMLKMKKLQNQQIKEFLNFPMGTNAVQGHRTHQENVNVTAVLDQHLHFDGKILAESDLEEIKILPVSPVDSIVWIDSSIYNLHPCCYIEENDSENVAENEKNVTTR